MASETVFTGNPKSEPTTEKVFTVVREQTPQRPGKVLTREAQNPKQTPRKVGKPTIEQLTGQGQALDTIRDLEPDKTDRTHQNMLYQAIGEKYVTDHADEIPGAERLLKGRGCLEQLGRMINDNIKTATILKQAKIVGAAMINGSTVKQVEQYLRVGRKHKGYYNEAILKTEIAGPNEIGRITLENHEILHISGLLRNYINMLNGEKISDYGISLFSTAESQSNTAWFYVKKLMDKYNREG